MNLSPDTLKNSVEGVSFQLARFGGRYEKAAFG
jgi:hypothetical protein